MKKCCGVKVGKDITADEIKKGSLHRQFKMDKPPMGVKPLPKMSSSLEGQLNCDHRKFEPVDPNKGVKIRRDQRRNYEHLKTDSHGNTI